MKGIIMDIQRFCLHDGPGIRTCVFFKGCNMKCIWCHNPESMELGPTLMYTDEKCVRCMACAQSCEYGVHSFINNRHLLERDKCRACGKCTQVCPSEALHLNGREIEADAVMEEIRKDERYYINSGGGVTFSGGEATLQFEFLLELLRRCRERGYQTALETNGLIPEARLKEISAWTDLFLLDYKADGKAHEVYTGVSGEGMLKSLKHLQEWGGRVYLRCPIIPGLNDTEQHFAAIRGLKKDYSCIEKVEIMAYHDIGKEKWKECGKEYSLIGLKTVSSEQKELWEQSIA